MELFEKHVRLFKKMKELASEQQSCLEEDRLDEYIHLSRERERIRSEITLNDKRAGWKEKKGSGRPVPGSSEEIMELVEIIRAIQNIDARIEEVMTQKKESLASEIRDMKKGRQAVRGYDRRAFKPAKFIDRKS